LQLIENAKFHGVSPATDLLLLRPSVFAGVTKSSRVDPDQGRPLFAAYRFARQRP
jgi:hypothetical protein